MEVFCSFKQTFSMNIVITGASSGIGFEVVKFLAKEDKHKIVAIARNAQKLQQLKADCMQLNAQAEITVIPFDLQGADFSNHLIPQIKNAISSIDVLINNAGAIVNKPFIEITSAELEQVYQVNVFGVFKLIQSLMSSFIPGAHIVNISSMGGYIGSAKFAGLSAYSSSKGALTTLSECLAEELKPKNIAVNCLCLGAVDTEMLQQAFPGYKAPISAREMANFVGDFALNAHRYFNGKVLPVSLSTP